MAHDLFRMSTNLVSCILSRLSHLDHIIFYQTVYIHLVLFQVSIYIKISSTLSFNIACSQAKSKIKKNEWQPSVLKDQDRVLRVLYLKFELIIYSKVTSRHQETASHSQKCTPKSNTTILQSIYISEQSCLRSLSTSYSHDKQPSHE